VTTVNELKSKYDTQYKFSSTHMLIVFKTH